MVIYWRKPKVADSRGDGALRIFFRLTLFLGLLFSLSGKQETLCAAEENNSIWYYRFLAPHERMGNWPFEIGVTYSAFDRKLFEEITSSQRVTAQKIADTLLQSAIQSIELDAELRGGNHLEGQGRFLIRKTIFSLRKPGETFSIPIQPIGFWLADPKTSEGVELSFGSTGNTVFLNFPSTFEPPVEQTGFVAVEFQWGLRGEREGREKLIFNMSAPQVPRSEWTLHLPPQWVPVPEGIVQEILPMAEPQAQTPQNRNASQKTWRISPGRNQTLLTIYSSESTVAALPTLPIRQTLSYNLLPEGLDVQSVVSITSEKEPRSTNVVVILDEPLRLASVLWGNQPLMVSAVNEGIELGTRSYHITVPPGEGDLIVKAMCPLQTDQSWNLPRIRLQSPQHFWMETRAHLFVKEPLIVYTLEPNQAIQTQQDGVLTGTDRLEGTRYSFQYFTPDSRIAVNMTLDSPGLTVRTGTLLHWEEEQITSTMRLDLIPLRQNAQKVELRIQPGWSIDQESLESVPKENLFHWAGEASNLPGIIVPTPLGQGDGATDSLYLFLQKPIKLKLTGSRPNLNLSELPLGELLPVRVYLSEKSREIGKSGPGASGDSGTGRHLIALTANAPNRLKPVGVTEQALMSIPVNDPEVRRHFTSEAALATASIYVLDTNSRFIPVRLEHQKLRFESKMECRLTLQDQELIQTCTFSCSPSETLIDTLYVHWTQDSPVPWTWRISGGDQALSSRILSEQERQAVNLSTPPGGVVEEVRLATPRSGSFPLEATRQVPLDRPTTIPLPMLCESVPCPVEVLIDSPYSANVEIVNAGLHSIPVVAPPKNEYQTIRAAFRYDPLRDIGNLGDPLLFLVPLKSDDKAEAIAMVSTQALNSSAWVWTLQLDSQFESTGLVREHATFFIENRGQKRITMTLPLGIPVDNVLAVYRDDERVTYDLQTGPDSAKSPVRISLVLPAKRRFLTVSLEYWRQSPPLPYRSKIRPFYPAIDLPVLGGTWIAWTPPEYQTFLRGRQEGLLVSEKENNGEFYLLSGLGSSLQSDPARPTTLFQPIDPFSQAEWASWFSTGDREKNSLPVAIRFIETLGNESGLKKLLKGTSTLESDSAPGAEEMPGSLPEVGSSTAGTEVITWGEMLRHPLFLETVFGDLAKRETPHIFIDWIALQRVGVFPMTPIRFLSDTSDQIAGHRVLESTGLSLVFLNERSLLITSTLNAAKYQWGLRPLFGDRVKVMRDGPLAHRFREAVSGVVFPQWISLEAWNNQVSSRVHPWGNISPSSQIASTAVGWNALELRRSGSENGIYVAHRPTLVAIHCFAFLFCVVVSCWKPFSNLVVLLVAAIVFGGLSMGLPLYYAVAPLGALFGTLFGLAFALIRREVPEKTSRANMQPGVLAPASEDSTDAEYEVRELRPFHNNPPSASTRREESFFDMLEDK